MHIPRKNISLHYPQTKLRIYIFTPSLRQTYQHLNLSPQPPPPPRSYYVQEHQNTFSTSLHKLRLPWDYLQLFWPEVIAKQHQDILYFEFIGVIHVKWKPSEPNLHNSQDTLKHRHPPSFATVQISSYSNTMNPLLSSSYPAFSQSSHNIYDEEHTPASLIPWSYQSVQESQKYKSNFKYIHWLSSALYVATSPNTYNQNHLTLTNLGCITKVMYWANSIDIF